MAWSGEDPELEKILESVTLYWLPETFPTSVYSYRGDSHLPLLDAGPSPFSPTKAEEQCGNFDLRC